MRDVGPADNLTSLKTAHAPQYTPIYRFAREKVVVMVVFGVSRSPVGILLSWRAFGGAS
jgi:hypothetical protein